MRRSHDVLIEHGEKLAHVKIACQGQNCPLCASRADDRARLTSVK